jgi:DNA modification methylase
MQIEWVNPKTLKPDPKNPNRHSKEQIDRLVKLIKAYGWRHPIIINKATGLIVVGHGRLEAALKIGTESVPVHYQDFKDEAEAYGFMVADNAIGSWSELDLAEINLEVPNLGPDFDIDLLGIKDFEIESADKYADKDADAVPESRETDIKLGDLFQLGNHRLLCADSSIKENVERLMNGEKANMVYTDPPYGFGYIGDFYQDINEREGFIETGSGTICGPRKVNKFKKLEGDSGKWDFDPNFILEFFEAIEEIYLWGADYYAQRLPVGGSWMCWNKVAGGEALDNMPGASFELCWSKAKHKRRMAPITWRGCFGHNKKNDGAKKVHPTQKPIALHDWFFGHYGKDKTNIVDLYGGSGSTLIACEKTNRKCFMMEIDPSYCQTIIDRFEKFSGIKAAKIES